MWKRANKALRRLTSSCACCCLWLALSSFTIAQPLETGMQLSSGNIFLSEGEIRLVTQDYRSIKTLSSKDNRYSTIYGPSKTLDDKFLGLGNDGLYTISVQAGKLTSSLCVEGENLEVLPWGGKDSQLYIAFDRINGKLTVVDSQGKIHLASDEKVADIKLINPTKVLLTIEKSFRLLVRLNTSSTVKLEPLNPPFPANEGQVTLSKNLAILWSAKNNHFLDLTSNKIGFLPVVPTNGIRALDNDRLLGSNSEVFFLWSPYDPMIYEFMVFIKPNLLKEQPIDDYTVFALNNTQLTFLQANEQDNLQSLDIAYDIEKTKYIGHNPTKVLAATTAIEQQTANEKAHLITLPEGRFKKLIVPEKNHDSPTNLALLFLETESKEPKLDEYGRPVYDLATNKPQELTIRGHKILSYKPHATGTWSIVKDEPRAGLDGAIELLNGMVIYATRSEPEHKLGLRQLINLSYPYPPAVLHGYSTTEPNKVWSYDKPRGENISKDRLPQQSFPALTEPGSSTDRPKEIVLTTEGDRVVLINPHTGATTWQSTKIAMDASTPSIYSWQNALSILVSKGTSHSLVTLDQETGKIIASASLNSVFIYEKWRHLLGLFIVCVALAYYIYAARKRELYIRQIAGLKELDEAVGRATEMGKPVLYVVGLADVDDIQTLASLSILSHVAKKTAEYDTPIVATTSRAVTFSAAQEIVRDAFSVAGHPDAFSVDSVRYITDDQFGYTAGVDGIMVREKPAANFYIGKFYAESLILAETGFATGAIQIAGTAEASQIPFFVAACDYTLIGEELFAASAYLSRDPLQVGSLRGQDVGKMIVMVILVVGSILISLGIDLETIEKLWGGAS